MTSTGVLTDTLCVVDLTPSVTMGSPASQRTAAVPWRVTIVTGETVTRCRRCGTDGGV